jgi:hypothetical protein
MAKATLRENGRMMVALTPLVSLDLKQIAQIVSHEIDLKPGGQFSVSSRIIRRWTRRDILDYCRDFVREYGLSGIEWSAEAETQPRIKAFATSIMAKRFPDLDE